MAAALNDIISWEIEVEFIEILHLDLISFRM